jgi:hypothetical protein
MSCSNLEHRVFTIPRAVRRAILLKRGQLEPEAIRSRGCQFYIPGILLLLLRRVSRLLGLRAMSIKNVQSLTLVK